MATITLDTYNFVERLTQAGMEARQAKAIVDGLKNVSLENVATKEDILTLKNELEKLELRMTIKTAVIVAAVIGFFRVMESFFSR